MTESYDCDPRMDLSDQALLHLCIYYIFVETVAWKVASLLNEIDKVKPGISTQQVTATYSYLHDTQHRVWVRAKDMPREESDELKRIMRDEVHCKREMWDVRMVQPVRPMAMLRLTTG